MRSFSVWSARRALRDMTTGIEPEPTPALGPFARFLVSGAFNTLVTYLLYLLLLQFLSYRISYTISYAAGIVLAYELNRVFVFKAPRSLASIAATPLIYLLQYCVGLGVVSLWVEYLGLSARIAPLVAIALTVPLTFVLTRWVFLGRAGNRRS